MRSCLGSILLFIVIVMLAATAFYQWNTNAKIDFSVRNPDDPMITTERYSVDTLQTGKNTAGKDAGAPPPTQPAKPADPYTISDNVMPVQAPTPARDQAPKTDDGIPTAEPVQANEDIPTAEPVETIAPVTAQ